MENLIVNKTPKPVSNLFSYSSNSTRFVMYILYTFADVNRKRAVQWKIFMIEVTFF